MTAKYGNIFLSFIVVSPDIYILVSNIEKIALYVVFISAKYLFVEQELRFTGIVVQKYVSLR